MNQPPGQFCVLNMPTFQPFGLLMPRQGDPTLALLWGSGRVCRASGDWPTPECMPLRRPYLGYPGPQNFLPTSRAAQTSPLPVVLPQVPRMGKGWLLAGAVDRECDGVSGSTCVCRRPPGAGGKQGREWEGREEDLAPALFMLSHSRPEHQKTGKSTFRPGLPRHYEGTFVC